MTTPTFNRGISDEFLEALNNEYKKGGWWRNLVDDEETLVAIRENYLNVYYRGNSLLKLDYTSSGFQPHTDSAFLSRRDIYDNLADVEGLKNAVNSHVHDSQKGQEEKYGVHDIIHNSCNGAKILDVEIRFKGYGEKQPDLSALCEVDEDVEVRFYEAKHFSNRSNLRKQEGLPKVIGQVHNYSKFVKEHRSELVKSYRKVCRNLVRLRGIAQRLPERHKLLERIADGSAELRINPNVWLIVFGFDADQKADQNWQKHEKKLFDELGDRLIMEGNPKNLKLIA